MVEEITCDITSCLSGRLFQRALEDQLAVFVGEFQIDVLTGAEFEVLVELHQIEVVLSLTRFDIDFRKRVLDHLDNLRQILLVGIAVCSGFENSLQQQRISGQPCCWFSEIPVEFELPRFLHSFDLVYEFSECGICAFLVLEFVFAEKLVRAILNEWNKMGYIFQEDISHVSHNWLLLLTPSQGFR